MIGGQVIKNRGKDVQIQQKTQRSLQDNTFDTSFPSKKKSIRSQGGKKVSERLG